VITGVLPVKKIIWSLLIVCLLAACASGVKLSDVPVEDKSGAQVNNSQGKDADKASKSANSSSSSAGASSSSNAANNSNVGTATASNLPEAKQPTAPASVNAPAPVNAPAAADAGIAGPANAAKVIYFDYDSYIVKPEFQAVIEGHAQFLKSSQRARVSIEGHTDERGSREYNLALGQKRADAVRQSLTLLGVSAAQIESVSFGEEKPAVAGSDEAAYAKNRRAEFFYK
jgi:peptidoglycan-associated lipoprotein